MTDSLNKAPKGERILRLREVLQRVGVSRATLYRWIAKGEFPRPVRLGIRARGWVESEVNAWIQARANGRSNQDEAGT